MEPIRINKYLSERGIASRREADKLIEEQRVTVNGVLSSPGQKVTEQDEIRIDGRPVNREAPRKVIIALYKPEGVVSTTRSFRNETNVVELVHYPEKLYPVGRLDKDSEGLIFLTNDGTFAAKVTDASLYHEKEYEVRVNKELTGHFLERMSKGVFLQELNRQTATCRVEKIDPYRFRIILTQGLNRQIRRMCETLGYEVRSLKRVRIMNVILGDMKAGEYREISGEERKKLVTAAAGKEAPRSFGGRNERG